MIVLSGNISSVKCLNECNHSEFVSLERVNIKQMIDKEIFKCPEVTSFIIFAVVFGNGLRLGLVVGLWFGMFLLSKRLQTSAC